MVINTTFLQFNMNHCARAQDLLLQSMAQWSIQLAVIAEPYRIPSNDGWVMDLDGLAALYSRTAAGGPSLIKVLRGHGWVAAQIEDSLNVSGYFSPNRPFSEFERYLGELGTIIASCGLCRILVAGDFNAKSVVWGSPATDVRGEEMMEWAVASGLSVINTGSVNTCVRRGGGSIVDITFASAALANRVSGWRVLEDVETLSDHKYVRFEVSNLSSNPTELWRPLPEDPPRWALKKLDRDLLLEATLVEAWLPRSTVSYDVATEVEWLGETMKRVCDVAMPRQGVCAPWRQVYWWTQEIAQIRTRCVAARRTYTRYRRRRRRHVNEENRLYTIYREHVTNLSSAICRAKAAAHEELIASLDRDPWGRPYRLVRNKLRPWAPPLTRSMQPSLVARVVGTLFPPAGDVQPPTMAPIDATIEDVDVPEVTEAELGSAILRMRAKNKAPGLDGVPSRALAIALKAIQEQVRGMLG